MTSRREAKNLRAEAERHIVGNERHAAPPPRPAPNVIDFVTGETWLNRPNLYPRQATLLKIMFLQDELFTDYDYYAIDQWVAWFKESGDHGIVPDVFERIAINKAAGRKWFRETDAVIGRRGGKGYLGALAGAYVLYHYLVGGDEIETTGNPQATYGIDSDKRLSAMVFGAKLAQAKANQWRDLVAVITTAPCFSEWIAKSSAESLTIYAPHDMVRIEEMHARGIQPGFDLATFEIVPKESTATAGRGPAAFMQFYDEMAHVVNSGANRSAEEVYQSATPALDQFGKDGFIYAPSSPWQRTGQFYKNCIHAQAVDEQTGRALYPEMLMVQLTSWDIYTDWKMTHSSLGLPMRAPLTAEQYPALGRDETWEEVPRFRPLQGAIQEYDDQMKHLERANPDTFNVERRSLWATTMDAYLNEARVDDIFAPFNGEPLVMQDGGPLSINYKMHGDPSKSGANFGLAIAHVVIGDDGWNHVVFDKLHAWLPADFDANRYEIDYRQIEGELKGYIDAFLPDEVSFDQFNSIHTIQELRAHVRSRQRPKRVQIFERTATKQTNWEVYETFKSAIGLGLVHAPYFELAELELKFLQEQDGRVDHPTSGPIQTKDVADCMAILVHALIGDQVASFVAGDLAALPLHASQPRGAHAPTQVPAPDPIRQLQELGRSWARRPRRSSGRPRPNPRGYGDGGRGGPRRRGSW